ncbi:MAG: helix-turn-helix domain-containing protein, partial [Gordonia amarae]
RLLLPQVDSPGRYWVNTLGECDIEALPGGWLVRVTETAAAGTTVVELSAAPNGGSIVTVEGGSGKWTHRPSPRHAQILAYLAAHPEGASAAQLSTHLFGVPDRTVTVRAEMSRLRKHLGGLIVAGPYRFTEAVEVRC